MILQKYPCVRVGRLVSMHITDILTKNSCFYHGTVFKNTKKTCNDIKYSKKVKIMFGQKQETLGLSIDY